MRRASRHDRHPRGHLTTSLESPTTGTTAPDEQSPRRRFVPIAVAVAAGALVVAVAGYALRPTSDPREEGGVAELEEPFPGLGGETVVGPPLDTGTMEWSVLVVNVWATWCEPCRREQPALLRVRDDYAERGVEFVGVNYNDDRAAARRWIDDLSVPYQSLYDPEGRTAGSLGFPFLPDTYLVDAEGTMRFVVYGETSAQELSGLIDELLDEQGAR